MFGQGICQVYFVQGEWRNLGEASGGQIQMQLPLREPVRIRIGEFAEKSASGRVRQQHRRPRLTGFTTLGHHGPVRAFVILRYSQAASTGLIFTPSGLFWKLSLVQFPGT